MSLKKIYLHDPVDQYNRTKEPCINDVGVKVADVTVAGMARVFVSLPSDHDVLAVDVVDEKVGIEYFVVHCERAFAHLIEMAIEWCASWVLLRLLARRGGLPVIVEGDALLGAVIDGGEGEAGTPAEPIFNCGLNFGLNG